MERFGRYEIVAQIGAGGMGQVVRAHDTERDRDVALKLLPDALGKDPEFQQRFRRESYAVARLRDPHVIPIHDYGEIDGRLYIDMRLVDGQSLAALVEQSGPLAPARAVGMVEQVADALDAAHAEELVHRDIKPSNVLVTTKDFVYVIDFGLAHTVGHRRTRLTMTGVTLGTLDYMAPERFENRPVDARTDVYSLACTLFECVTTSKPFPGDDFPTQMYGHLYLAPRHAGELNPEVPPALDDVIVRGMAKNPDDRYATAGELAAAAQAAVHRPAARATDTAPRSAGTVATSWSVTVPGPAEPVEGRTEHLPLPATSVSAPTTSAGAPSSTAGPEGPTEQVEPSRWGGSGVGVLDAPAPRTPAEAPPRQGPPSGPHGAFPTPPPGPPPAGPAPRSGFGPDGTPRGHGVRTGALVAIAVLLLAVASMGVALLVRSGGGDTAGSTVGAAAPGGAIDLDGPRRPAASVPRPTVGGTVVVGSTPGYLQVAPNGRFAYIANRAAGVITVFDTTRNVPIGTIPVPDGGPQFVAFSPDSARAYVSIFNQDYSLNEVAVIDTSSAAITARIPTGKRPFALVLSPDGRRLYVPNHDSGSITVADTDTNQVVDTVAVAPNPHWLDISPDGTRLYAANHESNVITTIDTDGDRVLGTTPVGRSPHSIVRHPTQPLVFNVNYDDSSVSVTNTDTGAVVGTIATASHPQDITLSADGRHAYLATVDANAIQVLDTSTLQITANVPVGRGPTSVAITPDGRQAYVTNLNDGSVTVLNVAGTA
ncbi:protein kinase domain-containing protein [Actinomycetospora sp. C-140]